MKWKLFSSEVSVSKQFVLWDMTNCPTQSAHSVIQRIAPPPQEISKIYQFQTRIDNVQLKHPIWTKSPVYSPLGLLFSQRNLAFMILHSNRHKSWVCLIPRTHCYHQLKKGLYTHDKAGRLVGFQTLVCHSLTLKPVVWGSGANLWPELLMIVAFIQSPRLLSE